MPDRSAVLAQQRQDQVLTSFPFLYCFAQNIAGDDANVVCLLPSQGPHGYQAENRDIVAARDADVFFANGLQLNDSVTNLVKSSGNPKVLFKVAEKIPTEKLRRMRKERTSMAREKRTTSTASTTHTSGSAPS
jgi:ABC-type Zn uptake system ZnuABC Zn-binding protein ZnuA